MSDNNLQNLFLMSYPKAEVEGDQETDFERSLDRYFEVHFMRTYNTTLVMAAANTGRHCQPRFWRDQQINHQSPQLMGGGWSTRFDGGNCVVANDPTIVVSIYVGADYEGEEVPHETMAFALVTRREVHDGRYKYFTYKFRGRVADNVGVMNDDGLEAVWEVLRTLTHQLELENLPDTEGQVLSEPSPKWRSVEKIEDERGTDWPQVYLDRATKHVFDSFGQGGNFFRRYPSQNG